MKKNKKGFTLVELLAVIVVLIVVLLIALVSVKKSKDKAQLKAIKANAVGYVDAINSHAEVAESTSIFYTGLVSKTELEEAGVDVSGRKPDDGFVIFNKYEPVYFCFQYGKYKAVKAHDDVEVIKGRCDASSVNILSYIDVMDFKYKGFEETFTINETGTYKLQVWGAQGGNSLDTNVRGGYGGYSEGTIELTAGDVLYVNVGQAGPTIVTGDSVTSYNGGGAGSKNDSNNKSCGSGGGATSIALKSGLLTTLSSDTDKILIVAGGGGGASTHASDTTTNGGDAGGYMAVAGTSQRWGGGGGGTQTAGGARASTSSNAQAGSFGKGGNGAANGGAGGGGGFYGGGGGHGGSAGGGSGYIGNANLTNKVMYCFGCEQTNTDSIKTRSTTCASDLPKDKCSKLGNGYVRITHLSDNDPNSDYDDD